VGLAGSSKWQGAAKAAGKAFGVQTAAVRTRNKKARASRSSEILPAPFAFGFSSTVAESSPPEKAGD